MTTTVERGWLVTSAPVHDMATYGAAAVFTRRKVICLRPAPAVSRPCRCRLSALLLALVCAGMLLAACQLGPGEAPPANTNSPPDAAPTDAAPTDAAPTDAAPTDAAPKDPPTEPTLSVADVSAAESAGALRFTVSLNIAYEPVTVSYATEDVSASEGKDYLSADGTLTFAAESNQTRQIEVSIRDDQIPEPTETFLLRLSDPRGAALAAATATGTIADDDMRAVKAEPAALSVTEAATATYTVVLGAQPTGTVTVTVTSGSPELTVQPERLSFTRADWATAQTVMVSAANDGDAVADPPIRLAHSAAGGGYDGAVAEVWVTIVEDAVATLPLLSIQNSSITEGTGDGAMRFVVRLQPASEHVVTVQYATADGTATAGADYTPADGTLTFLAGITTQTIVVPITDDGLEEPVQETFTVALSAAVNATVASGAGFATGEISDGESVALELAALQVSGAASEMYPAFAADIFHYALTCNDPATLPSDGPGTGQRHAP